jgi:hypothetical protein
MMMGTIKVDPKKDVCHLALVIETLMQHLFHDTSIDSTKSSNH